MIKGYELVRKVHLLSLCLKLAIRTDLIAKLKNETTNYQWDRLTKES
jgi:hypothetical protein